jgi:hypothetical protein
MTKVPGLARAAIAASLLTLLFGCATVPFPSDIPHLETRDGMAKLIVDGQPFICVAGELRNSTSSDPAAVKTTFARLARANLNTILSVVSWDLIEPREGAFDFSMVDRQLEAARENHVRLVLLWMGSWKNGLSHYPPEWVKANQARFPRVVNADGNSLEILSTFSTANRDADARAFAAFMRHLREADSRDHTVIAIQVENEAGLLGSSRDFCPAANRELAAPVPASLMAYMQQNRDHLLPEFHALWNAAGTKTAGTWEEVFGKNVPRPDPPVPNSPTRSPRPADFVLTAHTDEIFMAWHYSNYIGYVAAQGKKEYPLPMYVNTWIVQPNDRGPGDYPSGGPEPLVHDIWRAGAPAIDILAPDVYLPQYAQIIQNFARHGNPAFNPETRQDGDNCWTAFTQLNVLCFSPFGIDNLNPESPFARTYGFVSSISGALAVAQGRKDAIKLLTPQAGQNPGKVEMGDYVFDFTRSTRRGRGAPGIGRGPAPSTAPAQPQGRGAGTGLSFLNAPFLAIIQTAPNEFYFATNGDYPFTVALRNANGRTAAPASIDRGSFQDGRWVTSHRFNGDDIMGLGYDISGAAARHEAGTLIPLGRGRGAPGEAAGEAQPPTVLRVRFYQYQ